MPRVSVIIPCYKQAKYLPETLDSVLSQTYNDWECIMVNDGSPDNTEEVAKMYCKEDNRFKYLYQENQGPATARNNGIKASSGEYILPLDSDDLISPTYIEKAVAYLDTHSDVKLVYSRTELFSETERRECDMGKYTYKDFLLAECLIFSASIYRKVDYDKTIGYNPNMIYGIEDWDFWLSLLKKEDIVFRIDEVLFYYRVKEKSRTTELISNDSYLEEVLMQIYENHKNIYSQYYNRIILFHNNAVAYYENNKTLSDLRKDYNKIRYSLAYRVGRLITKPFSLLLKTK